MPSNWQGGAVCFRAPKLIFASGSKPRAPALLGFTTTECVADDMVEKMCPEVTLHDIDGVALRQLIEYSYTGEILITEDNVQVSALQCGRRVWP